RRTVAVDVGAHQDQRRDGSHSRTRPARGAGDERAVHHPGCQGPGSGRALLDAPVAGEPSGTAAAAVAGDGGAVRRFLDALLGRARPLPAKNERLFAISTAMVTLELQLGLKAIDRAGITFKPVESNYFERMSVDLNALLEISTRDTG